MNCEMGSGAILHDTTFLCALCDIIIIRRGCIIDRQVVPCNEYRNDKKRWIKCSCFCFHGTCIILKVMPFGK